MTRLALAGLHALLVLLVPAVPAGAQRAGPPASRLVDEFRYTAAGDLAVFTFLEVDGRARDTVTLLDRRGVVTTAPLADGRAVLRVDDLPPGAHDLKACSSTTCALGRHVVFDGPVDGAVVALLGRRATAEELAVLGGHPIAAVARLLAADPERVDGIVRELYRFHLGREPEPAGLAYWRARLAAGATPEEVAAALCGAEPRFPSGIREGECRPVEDFLGRAPTTVEVAAPPSPGAASVSEGAREWTVRRVFVTLLGREPEVGARRYWSSLVDGSVASDALLVGVLGSEEYVEHVSR